MPATDCAQGPLRHIACTLVALLLAACNGGDRGGDALPAPDVAAPLTYLGSAACADCHEAAYSAWRGSHHALAMQVAGDETVLGDFSGATFQHDGVTSTFFRRDGRYFVRTDDAAGELADFAVSYTFGVTPLQQYLVEFPGGRLQALPLAWDSRPESEGGQRWFHVYGDRPIAHTDPLHWTGREQNWNYMCAECHSTNLVKNYRADSDRYDTTWDELTVGCEACHGPGSRHVTQATSGEFMARAGFPVDLDDAGRASWVMNPENGIAARSEPRMRPPAQPEACGRCHSRRSVASTDYEYGRPLLDTHLPALLDDGLYYSDGQILDEVYVYGSFLQSRMYQAGVTCSDCHEPHAATLRSSGEPSNVCSTCHLPATFDTPAHHRHPPGSVSCVDCHMASRNYMVIDGRRDHSFRVPRPRLGAATGSPNACNGCHEDRDSEWAVQASESWFGDDSAEHYGYAIHAGRTGGGNERLVAAIAKAGYPGIARATALSLLRPPYAEPVMRAIRDALTGGDALVRVGALRALPGLQPELQVDWAAPLLSDRVRAVRIEAARAISPLRSVLNVRDEAAFAAAERELVDSLAAIGERPEALVLLGNLYADAGDPGRSEAAFRKAQQIAPADPAASVNLADLYRRLDRDADAEVLLRERLAAYPGAAALRHALGLLLVRRGQAEEGLAELGRAAELEPGDARYAYVYAVGLNSLGRPEDAVAYLGAAVARFPGDFDVHWALATMLRDLGRTDEARRVATNLSALYPGIPPLENLLGLLGTGSQ